MRAVSERVPSAFSRQMCIRCQNADASEPLGLCPVCAVQTRLEFGRGLRRLSEYLAAWAAFDEWLRDREAKLAGVG